MQKFKENRTYGVEIEFLKGNMSAGRIVEELRLAGVEVTDDTNCYNHQTKPTWKLMRDSSCGYEMVSPILKGTEDLCQIEVVCSVLRNVGAKVSSKCGLHVHHQAKDLKPYAATNIIKFYANHYSTLQSLFPQSRRDNRYCRFFRINKNTVERDITRIHQTINNCLADNMKDTISNLVSDFYCYDRYQVINMKCFQAYGTIEFRQHQGTLNATKIINWIKFTQIMLTMSNKKVIDCYEHDNINDLMYRLNIYRTSVDENEVAKYYKKINKKNTQIA